MGCVELVLVGLHPRGSSEVCVGLSAAAGPRHPAANRTARGGKIAVRRCRSCLDLAFFVHLLAEHLALAHLSGQLVLVTLAPPTAASRSAQEAPGHLPQPLDAHGALNVGVLSAPDAASELGDTAVHSRLWSRLGTRFFWGLLVTARGRSRKPGPRAGGAAGRSLPLSRGTNGNLDAAHWLGGRVDICLLNCCGWVGRLDRLGKLGRLKRLILRTSTLGPPPGGGRQRPPQPTAGYWACTGGCAETNDSLAWCRAAIPRTCRRAGSGRGNGCAAGPDMAPHFSHWSVWFRDWSLRDGRRNAFSKIAPSARHHPDLWLGWLLLLLRWGRLSMFCCCCGGGGGCSVGGAAAAVEQSLGESTELHRHGNLVVRAVVHGVILLWLGLSPLDSGRCDFPRAGRSRLGLTATVVQPRGWSAQSLACGCSPAEGGEMTASAQGRRRYC